MQLQFQAIFDISTYRQLKSEETVNFLHDLMTIVEKYGMKPINVNITLIVPREINQL